MTAEELRSAVEAGDASAVIRLLRGASETERRALAPTARELRAQLQIVRVGGSVAQDEAAQLAVYGTATVSELRAARGPSSWPPRRHEAEVLSGRPAAVVAPLIAWQLERFWGWHVARSLVRDGTIPTPETEWYILRLIGDRASPRDRLREDPGLLDHEVWRLFEIEGSGEFCLAARDKYAAPSDTWETALLEVAASPQQRERLLDASLDALGRDFSTFRAGWFSRFHEALEPSIDERAARADRYAALLRSQIKPTLTMSIGALAALDAAGRLEADAVLGRFGQVLAGAASSTATAAIRLLRGVGEREPGRSAAVIRDLLDALAHPSADVQGSALSAASALATGPDAEAAAALVSRMDGVSASRRAAASALLGTLAGEIASQPSPTAAGPSMATAAPARSPTDHSRAIGAVADAIELVELLSGLLESAEAPDDLERALDGLARLSNSVDDDRLVRPLHRRAAAVRKRAPGDRQAADVRHDVAALVLSWLDREPVEPPRLAAGFPRQRGAVLGLTGLWFGEPQLIAAGADRFLARRLMAVARASAERRPMRLLATPTHRGGWIDPAVLVDRLRQSEAPDALDLVAALLRLGPDGRQEALAAAGDLTGEAGAALRHALGSSEEVTGDAPAVWAAAARARMADGDDPDVIARHPGLGPNGGRAARISFVAGAWNEVPGGFDMVLDPPAPAELDDDQPATVLLVAPFPAGYEASGDPAMCRWVATIWPAGVETWSGVGAVVIGRNIDWWSAEWTNRIHLEALLDPWVQLGPVSRVLLGLGLGAKERGERGLAADVAISAIGDGRLDGAALTDALRSTVGVDRARPRRWAEALADVAGVSADHAITVIAGIGGVLPALHNARAADMVALLRVLRELVPQQPHALDASAVQALESVPGRGATRKVADEILAAVR